jgi:uncharacterized membrane protein
MEYITALFFLLFAHFLADFAFQSDFMSKYKYELWYVMLVHCFVWIGCLIITAAALGLYIPFVVWVINFGIHWFVDWYKCRCIARFDPTSIIPKDTLKRYFMNDQVVHLVQIVFLSLF